VKFAGAVVRSRVRVLPEGVVKVLSKLTPTITPDETLKTLVMAPVSGTETGVLKLKVDGTESIPPAPSGTASSRDI